MSTNRSRPLRLWVRRCCACVLACAMFAAQPDSRIECALSPVAQQSNGSSNKSQYVADMAKLNALWPGDRPIVRVEDAYTVLVDLGETKLDAPTHLFGGSVNIIPYSNEDSVKDAAGAPVPRGDSVIAEYFPPGQIGIAIRHHRPEHRLLKAGVSTDLKEHVKLQDTHVEIVVGVERDGQPGAITVNNPQDYEKGRFADAAYSLIFFRPKYPGYLSPDQVRAFNDNVRTMLIGFNAVSDFPGNYNGGDPLAARNPAAVRQHAAMMVRAVAGDADARAFFKDPANLIYCSELVHVSASAGLIAPLNAHTFVPLVGEKAWAKFVMAVEAHNSGRHSPFTEMNSNKLVALVKLSLAPEKMQPCAAYAPTEIAAPEAAKLAFKPMTMSDIVEQFIRTHLNRELVGETLAPAQGAVLRQVKLGILEAIALDQLPTTDPRRQAAEDVYDQIVAVVNRRHESYAAFRRSLEPLLAKAREMTGPRGESGQGLFVPPSLLHAIAQGKHAGGLLGLEYVGHGLHFSVVRKRHSGVCSDCRSSGCFCLAHSFTGCVNSARL